ncbi:Alpha/beta hydrolase fold-1 [Mycena alexandri]|uniref:Alpha/beta hydrolase fold-1 n=1 Tax=Mycena alexandri TaxID=1745969 RepID=A0AAD6STD5_9AGAR|nr:Alpha/beta hydrolase fold-1 [Mycena alexandri]
MSPKPTFVLVPGATHTPAHLQLLADSLEAKGYPTQIFSLPSVGALAATAPPNIDAVNLRGYLGDLINNEEKEVILFCHSYGGVPGSQSVKGLERSAREKAGEKGGIVKVIFLSAFLPLEGESVLDVVTRSEMPSGEQWLEADPASGTFKANSKTAAALYHDLPDDQAQKWVSKLEPIYGHAVPGPAAVNVCWDVDVAKVAILCKKDRAILLEGQQRMLKRAQGVRNDGWEIYELDCGHSPVVSHVGELTEILVKGG